MQKCWKLDTKTCRSDSNISPPKRFHPLTAFALMSLQTGVCREVETYDTHNLRDPLAAAVDPETGVVYVLVGYLAEVSSSVFDVLLVQRMRITSCDHLADHVHVSVLYIRINLECL